MRELAASLLESEVVWPQMHRLRLRIPDLGTVGCGQFLLLRMLDRRDPVLSVPLVPCGQHSAEGWVEALWPQQAGNLTLLLPGQPLAALGPAGRAFTVDSRTRRMLLVGAGAGLGPLLYLAKTQVQRGQEVTFVAVSSADGQQMPGAMLPPEVEYAITPAAAQGLAATLEPLLTWADQLFLALPGTQLPEMLTLLRRRLLRLRRGFAQALLLPQLLPCGVGACELCVVQTRDGYRRLCRDGLVFDLLSLV